ncbi:hypothetical protein JZ751_000912 [Albula glossodonta]|uniref:Uncharacterized protein n=1 Tax=Albula glossodonta TaxID=121402 RepID=A0A8T2PXR9_9TELE|nr:hypothetical protein JZ751_000912 [Albula glossodonta]
MTEGQHGEMDRAPPHPPAPKRLSSTGEEEEGRAIMGLCSGETDTDGGMGGGNSPANEWLMADARRLFGMSASQPEGAGDGAKPHDGGWGDVSVFLATGPLRMDFLAPCHLWRSVKPMFNAAQYER